MNNFRVALSKFLVFIFIVAQVCFVHAKRKRGIRMIDREKNPYWINNRKRVSVNRKRGIRIINREKNPYWGKHKKRV